MEDAPAKQAVVWLAPISELLVGNHESRLSERDLLLNY
jgi:hypothetical protein